jgi:hypothetical protein
MWSSTLQEVTCLINLETLLLGVQEWLYSECKCDIYEAKVVHEITRTAVPKITYTPREMVRGIELRGE